MDNKTIVRSIKLMGQLMELHQVNEFKARTYNNAAFTLSKAGVDLMNAAKIEIATLKGVGNSVADKIEEIKTSGAIKELNELLDKTPEGVLSMMKIKGLGPKKVYTLWKDFGFDNIMDLYYACNENRLIEVKGFGDKTQAEIKKNIEFLFSNQGKFHFASALATADEFLNRLSVVSVNVSLTGDIRRKEIILTQIDFIVSGLEVVEVEKVLEKGNCSEVKSEQTFIKAISENGFPLSIQIVPNEMFHYELIKSSTDAELFNKMNIEQKEYATEEEVFASKNIQFIEPELRSNSNVFAFAQSKKIPHLIQYEDLKGTLHNHTTYSDGLHTLKEMSDKCIEMGLSYFGVCDHSQTAGYAGGLKPDRVLQQHKEIDQLNQGYKGFKIFKGIESDILLNGDLDYEEDMLKQFDFVVASIHSGLKMDEETATTRIIKAIENPYTTILGHPTGRLLLGRAGYPVNHQKMIDACAANGVILELNASPYRLDLDWTWIPYALEKGVMISINPDAHSTAGLADMYFGVYAARKGMLTAAQCFNAKSLEEIESYFSSKRK
jgi:DNA polymerase (family X)